MKKSRVIGVAIIFVMISITATHFFVSNVGAADKTPPVTVISFSGETYEKDGDTFIGPGTTIWLNATDEGTGVKYLNYEIWRDSDNDGVVDTLEESRKIIDNDVYFYDKNRAARKISVALNIDEECLHKIIYWSEDYVGNVEYYGMEFVDEWYYYFQHVIVHMADSVKFGSSAAVSNMSGNVTLEIFTGSDEVVNFFPEINATARGLWRCFDAYGNILFAIDTNTDEARSSPAIADIDGDGIKEVVAGTTSGWFVEVMEGDDFEWTFPAMWDGPVYSGPYVWHSSPALVDANSEVDGMEVFIGNNPYKSVWCFDGDNSDGIDDGITINDAYFPWGKGPLGNEGIEWDVIWVYNTTGRVIASPAVDDIDGDGVDDVVIGDTTGTLYILNAIDGSLEWSFSAGGAIYSSAALADIDDDGFKEIIFGSNDGKVYCLQWNGIWGMEEWNFTTGGAVYSSPSVGDIDGDGNYEIIFGSNDYNVYCLNASGVLIWNVTTGGAVYSSPALVDKKSGKYGEEWPFFRGNLNRDGVYPEKGRELDMFIGSDDGYIYNINASGGVEFKFLTNGRIHTSPVAADVDGDGFINIMFYDWGGDDVDGNDTFWCLEKGEKNTQYVRVDVNAPQTIKKVMSKDEYNITSSTDIWLNATDIGNCSSGVKYIHYEVWYDSNDDNVVDTMVESHTIYDNGAGDENSSEGAISVLLHILNEGLNELRWYAVDNVGNVEEEHFQEHEVVVYAPHLTITKDDSKDPVHPGDYLHYYITITNDGNANATNIFITDT
ncbi:MAG: PQQ-binding-like beta-propeller repeat protein, partial [Thermoplasmata archaeon]|nr:PQQ-binding-like beta-propeller repeat protein [Thermoplasmata archaeon]